MIDREREEDLAGIPKGADANLLNAIRDAKQGFEPGFASRVMARIAEEHEGAGNLSSALRARFRRWAPLGLAASLALAAFNLSQADLSSGGGFLDGLLGLETEPIGFRYQISVPGMGEGGLGP